VKPITYSRRQVTLMIHFARLEGRGELTPRSFGLRKDGSKYVWQPR
jgi:hypothetical protein